MAPNLENEVAKQDMMNAPYTVSKEIYIGKFRYTLY